MLVWLPIQQWTHIYNDFLVVINGLITFWSSWSIPISSIPIYYAFYFLLLTHYQKFRCSSVPDILIWISLCLFKTFLFHYFFGNFIKWHQISCIPSEDESNVCFLRYWLLSNTPLRKDFTFKNGTHMITKIGNSNNARFKLLRLHSQFCGGNSKDSCTFREDL